jgi:hypothetical protein
MIQASFLQKVFGIWCVWALFPAGISSTAKPALNQEIPAGVLYNLRTASFPVMKVSVDVYAPEGGYQAGLTKADFTILEDGRELPLDGFSIIDPGVEFVVAINPGYSLGIQDNKAVSRYEYIADGLAGWAGKLSGRSNDAYSLVLKGGTSAFHVEDPQSWLVSLDAYRPDFRKLTGSLDILSQAIDIASASMLPPGSRRAILLVTSNATMDDLSTLESLALRASQLDIHVFVWVVASLDSAITPGYLALAELANVTGGSILLYSGKETIPDPSDLLAPLRKSYQLTYASGVNSSGNHTLAVRVSTPTGVVDLDPLEFSMDIQPPNPIMISLPSRISREFNEQGNYEAINLVPTEQKIEMIIEFPDGHPRQLVSTSLVIDNVSVATNTSAPFDQFVWDLGGYTTSGTHELQVAVVDMLGLQGISLPIPITVSVSEPPSSMTIFLSKYGRWFAPGAAGLGSLLLAGLLIRIYRRKRNEKRLRKFSPRGADGERKQKQPSRDHSAKNILATLEPFPEGGQMPPGGDIQLVARKDLIGSDESLATIFLEDASVSPLHAVIHWEENAFFISDQGSLSGTWVNYEMLSEGKHRLKHGDIIHFGKPAFRFRMSKPPEGSNPRIILESVN